MYILRVLSTSSYLNFNLVFEEKEKAYKVFDFFSENKETIKSLYSVSDFEEDIKNYYEEPIKATLTFCEKEVYEDKKEAQNSLTSLIRVRKMKLVKKPVKKKI